MFVPITSEVTLGRGTIIREIATGRLYELSERIKTNPDVWGDDPWEIREAVGADRQTKVIGYLELAEKFLVDVEVRS